MIVVYYESLKRDLKTKPIHEFRCDERRKTKVEESTRLACTQKAKVIKKKRKNKEEEEKIKI